MVGLWARYGWSVKPVNPISGSRSGSEAEESGVFPAAVDLISVWPGSTDRSGNSGLTVRGGHAGR